MKQFLEFAQQRALTIALLFSFSAVAEAQFQYVITNNTVTITGANSAASNVIVPSTLAGLPVVAIGDNVFYQCYSATNVSIPASVTNISESAFYYCTKLKSISVDPLSTSFTSINGVLFNGSRTVLIQYPATKSGPYSVSNDVVALGQWAFNFCVNLTAVDLPATVTNITGPNNVFASCPFLNSITVATNNPQYSSVDGVLFNKDQTSILYYPHGRHGGYVIPPSVQSIATNTFSGHPWLSDIVIGPSVTNIGDSAFFSCGPITNVFIGDNVMSIGEGAFQSGTGIKTLRMGTNVTSIGKSAFWGCSAMGEVILPESATVIGNYAFRECSALTNISLSSGVTNFGVYAFAQCSKLSNFVMPQALENIAAHAFESCGFTNIVLNDKLRNIGDFAFQNCYQLPEILIPNSVTNVGKSAFSNCSLLSRLTLSTNIADLRDGSFAHSSLTTVDIPASVTNIGLPFQSCNQLTNINVDAENENYSTTDGLLYDKHFTRLILCPIAKPGTILIPDPVIEIGTNAFNGCIFITNVVFGSNITTIRSGAFYQCPLTSITFSASLTNIEWGAFSYDYGLQQVFWPGNAPSGSFANFYECHPTIYVLPGATGWGTTFMGAPIATWQPTIQLDAKFGVRTNGFAFEINWGPGASYVVDVCTNLATGIWEPIHTNTLEGFTAEFQDPDYAGSPARFYRIRCSSTSSQN